MNAYDAFVLASVLSIGAPTNQQARQAAQIAKSIALELSPLQIQKGREEAMSVIG